MVEAKMVEGTIGKSSATTRIKQVTTQTSVLRNKATKGRGEKTWYKMIMKKISKSVLVKKEQSS